MVDEAHERSLATDALLGLLRKVTRVRPSLRLVIASATLDVARLLDFFGGSNSTAALAAAAPVAVPPPPLAPPPPGSASDGKPAVRTPAVLSVQGRLHPVKVRLHLHCCFSYCYCFLYCCFLYSFCISAH